MASTIVIQSHRENAPGIVARATASVRAWADANGFDYALKQDELFDLILPACLDAAGPRKQMAADIARLAWTQQLLDDGRDRPAKGEAHEVAVRAHRRVARGRGRRHQPLRTEGGIRRGGAVSG